MVIDTASDMSIDTASDAASGETNVPFARPYIGKEEEDAVLRVLRSGWLTTGEEALAFEKEFQAFLGQNGEEPLYCLAVNSATSGLHLALEASGVGPGDAVLLPSYTFASTAEVVRYLGAEPVFVDTAPGSYLIDTEKLEETVLSLKHGRAAYAPRPGGRRFGPSGRPRAVIPVHFGGLGCDMEAVTDIARRYGLAVVEDAAHSFPAKLASGSWAGTAGDLGVFSFYATKTITTGEGGMIVSRNGETAKRVRVMRSHGIDRPVWNRYTGKKAKWYYEVIEPGYKYNLPDILAAIGRVQLGRAMDLLAMRKNIALAYDAAFRDDGHFTIPPSAPGDARHLYPLRLNRERLAVDRDTFIEKLQERGIGVSVHFIPLHIMPYYKKRQGLESGDFPVSFAAYRDTVSLPIWPGMSGGEIERVIGAVKSLAEENSVRGP